MCHLLNRLERFGTRARRDRTANSPERKKNSGRRRPHKANECSVVVKLVLDLVYPFSVIFTKPETLAFLCFSHFPCDQTPQNPQYRNYVYGQSATRPQDERIAACSPTQPQHMVVRGPEA
ncbi:uncharacterized protein Dsimw501_GD23249 [Drosophila simulans]|uniref:Uncharacterized protein n=1 Tax=Drosophila simulans TaxID=7240 RepID=A0A0J9QV91_DROSI|nr:uncharacterized protein Dsimw501_GD23249 [Drosophila simulans]